MNRLRKLADVRSLAAAGVYAAAGVGFAVTTIVMGRLLTDVQMATAVLLIALCNVGAATAPSPLQGVVVQHALRSDRRLLLVSMALAVLAAVLTAAIGSLAYGLQGVSLAALFVSVLTGGIAFAAIGGLQRAHEFQRAALLSQSANAGLIIASVLMVVGIGRVQYFPTAVVAVVFLVTGVLAWRRVWNPHGADGKLTAVHWHDGAHFLGLAFAGEVAVQVERFIIPLALSTHDLAVYSVVAALVLAPYRVLEMGANSTLPAQLRPLTQARARRKLIRRDFAILMSLALAGGVVLVLVAPWVCKLVLVDDEFPRTLIVAAVVGGVVRVVAAVALGLARGVCDSRELGRAHGAAWVSLVVGATAGVALAPSFGLPGLLYGAALGWLARAGMLFGVARRHLKVSAA